MNKLKNKTKTNLRQRLGSEKKILMDDDRQEEEKNTNSHEFVAYSREEENIKTLIDARIWRGYFKSFVLQNIISLHASHYHHHHHQQ